MTTRIFPNKSFCFRYLLAYLTNKMELSLPGWKFYLQFVANPCGPRLPSALHFSRIDCLRARVTKIFSQSRKTPRSRKNFTKNAIDEF